MKCSQEEEGELKSLVSLMLKFYFLVIVFMKSPVQLNSAHFGSREFYW